MCIWIPEDTTPERRVMLEAFARVVEARMVEALSHWTEEDWAELERGIAEDEANECR